MLDFMRRQQKNLRWIWVVLIFIFSASLVTLYMGFGDMPVAGVVADDVAEVGDETISAREFEVAYRNYLSQMQQQMTPEILRAFRFDRQILDFLITSKVVAAEAKRLGLDVAPTELERVILANPVFLENGKFIGVERYRTLLQNNNLTVEEFENGIRTQLLNNKLRDFVSAGVTMADSEVEQEYRRRNEKAKLDYFVISPTDLESKITLTDQEQLDFFEKNKGRYNQPERRQAKYVVVDTLKYRRTVTATDQELQDYFTQHQEEYRLPEQVTAQHILFKTAGMTEEQIAPIREKARGVLERVKKGEDFAALAKQFSEDNTASNGGDLGTFGRGMMVPEFEQVAFGLGPGATSELVQTQFGIHIIKVNSKQESRLRDFNELKEAIRSIVLGQKADQQALQAAQQVAAELGSNNDTNAAAQKFGAEAGETPFVDATAQVPEIGAAQDFTTRLFTMSKGEVGTPIKVTRGYVVPILNEIQAPRPSNFGEAASLVATDAKSEKAQQMATDLANRIQEEFKAGRDLNTMARAVGATVKTSELITRGGAIPEFGAIGDQEKDIFSLPIGKLGTPSTIGGKTLVYSVKERQDINPEEMKNSIATLRGELLSSKREQYFNAYIQERKKKMEADREISINESVLAVVGAQAL
jgi:peptidyl-prolyl cis-trans isomerase D